jgi:Protein of unknown function (DUF3822)
LHAIKKEPVKQLFHISAGEVKESLQPVLSIRVGEKHCSFSITDFISKEVKQLAYYSAEEVNDDFLNELFATHEELNITFYQVLICYDYPQSCLVAFKEYKHGDAGLLLNTMFGLNRTSAIISESIAEWQLYNVYAVPGKVHDWLTKKFPSGKYWHQYTLNIKNSKPAMEGGSLLVDIRNEDFTLLATANNKIILAQTFSYSTPDDIIYYLLKVCQQFGLSQQEVCIELSGLVDQQSALYRELYQYFLQVEFRDTDWTVPASANNESPAHFFTSLNDLAQCAL